MKQFVISEIRHCDKHHTVCWLLIGKADFVVMKLANGKMEIVNFRKIAKSFDFDKDFLDAL